MTDLASYVPFVEDALSKALRNIETDADHQGGYFCIINPLTTGNTPTLVIGVGLFPALRAERRFRLAIEKATRLQSNPVHVSSEQSKCDKKEHFGGAIRTDKGLIFSFSGLPRGIDDEAVCLLTAERLGQISKETIGYIVALSNNDVYHRTRDVRI